MIDSVEAPDDTTFIAHLKISLCRFPDDDWHQLFRDLLRRGHHLRPDFMYHPVGTGPYRLEGGFHPGQSFTLVYNENYYGPEPDIKRIEFKIQPDTNTAVISLQNGEVTSSPR